MRNPRMVRLKQQQLFKDCSSLFSFGVRRIIVAIGILQRKRIKSGCLMIVGVAAVELFHAFQVILLPLIVFLARMPVERNNCRDIIPFPRRLWVKGFRDFDFLPPPL